MINNITVIIVSYKSKKTIFNCLKSIEHFNKILILDNSNDKELKKNLKNKYSKIKFFLSKTNNGYGAGYNFLLKKVKTPYALLMTPDTSFKKGTLNKFLLSLKKFQDNYCLMGPFKQNKIFALENKKTISEASLVYGFSMFINMKNINKNNFFDENIFLYLENDDFCKRLVDHNEEIYVVPKSKINHLGGKAVSQKFSEEVELSRNWHWIWSKFYFKRKHKGYFFALINGLPTFFSAVLKYILYLIIFNPKKSKIYLHRAMGYLNAAIGRKSFFRPNIKI